MNPDISKILQQAISYGLIGVSCSFIDVALFSAFVYLGHIDELIANAISVAIGLTISFVCNRKFTFKIYNHAAIRYVLFFCVGMLGLGFSELILYGLSLLGFTPIISKLFSVVFVGLFQFICNKFISFKSRTQS